MGLLVYKVSDYEHTAEREQFRNVCKSLKTFFGGKEDLCIFIANYNIFDCELDGILIKQDAVISVEFKNYGGKVVAVENGQWKLQDGTEIKGGARKSVYQQAKLNHIAVRDGFKEGGILPTKCIKDVAALVVFNQNIELENHLSSRTQSWLHITDNAHFLEKVEDITSKNTEISNEDMLALLDKLALDEDCLCTEYSNAEVLRSSLQSKKENDDDASVYIEAEDEANKNLINISQDETSDLFKFLTRIVATLFPSSNAKVHIYKGEEVADLFNQHAHPITKEYVVVVEDCDKLQFKTKLEKFLKKELFIIGNILFWEEGETLTSLSEKVKVQLSSEESHSTSRPKRKMSTTLPHWLDIMLFEELGAIHCPEHKRFEYNLDLTKSETRTYLGTYFPRSYAESFCIFSNLFSNKNYLEVVNRMSTISILDFGCGTGGELLGLLTVIDKFITDTITINMELVDGNEHALHALQQILAAFTKHTKKQLHISLSHRRFATSTDLMNHNMQFDFILCNKVVCELISHKIITLNPYLQISQMLLPKLTGNGLFLLLDVTTKDDDSGLYYPQIMNREVNRLLRENNEFVNILPISCSVHKDCTQACFTQQIFKISHSRKKQEESKVSYRVICRETLWKVFCINCNPTATYIIQHQKSNDISCSINNNLGFQMDAFDINAKSS